MVAIKVQEKSNREHSDMLVFVTLSAKDKNDITKKVREKFQSILDEGGYDDYYDAYDELVMWCEEKFGERPHNVIPDEIDVEWR